MLDIFLYAGRAIMPLLLMMALGCGLRRVGRWSDDFYRQLNGFCFHVLLPVQLFLNVYAIEDQQGRTKRPPSVQPRKRPCKISLIL